MGFAKRLADFENTQLKWSNLLSFNAGPDSYTSLSLYLADLHLM